MLKILNMKTEKEAAVEEKELKSPQEFWDELMELSENDDASQVEYLLMHRGDFGLSDVKLPGEDEIYNWLQGRAENKLGRKLQVELNEKGIIVPIENERVE